MHGLKGALVVSGDNLESIEVKKKGFLFIEINNISTPFFISEVKMAGKNMVLTFDGIDTVEKAKPYIGKDVYGDEKNVSEKKNAATNIEGYDLVDEVKGNMGKINELIDLPKQKFLSIDIDGEETLFPYTDVFVKKIDHKAKTV